MGLIKTAGLLLIFTAAVGGGFLVSESYKSECRRLDGLLRLVRFTKEQIGSYRTPLDEIYRRFGESLPCLGGFSAILREKGFAEAVENAKGLIGDKTVLSALGNLGKMLGKAAAEEQIGECERCEKVLSDALGEAKTALPSRLRLCRTLGLACAVTAVILLI